MKYLSGTFSGVLAGVLMTGLIVFSPLAPAQDNERQMEGEIVDVQVSDRRISVRLDETGNTRTFTADDDTVVRPYGGFDRGVDGLRDLGPGDEVTLIARGATGQERVTRIEQTTVAQASRPETDRQEQETMTAGTRQQQQQQQQQQEGQYLPSTSTPQSYYVLAAGLLLLAVAATLRLVRKTSQARARNR